jgi:hypothetical protein
LICASAIRSFRLRVENLRYQTVQTEIVIDPHFNGPPGSANGGYTCGLVTGLLGLAALDCPGAYALEWAGRSEMLLGRLHGRVDRVLSPGERCVVIGWPLGRGDGRKGYAGTALWSADRGDLLACASATWIATTA